jgi:hypothetical protein
MTVYVLQGVKWMDDGHWEYPQHAMRVISQETIDKDPSILIEAQEMLMETHELNRVDLRIAEVI